MPTAIAARHLLFTHRPHRAGGCAPCTTLAGSSRSDRPSIRQPILEAHWRHSVRVGVGSCGKEVLEPKLLQKKYNLMSNKKRTQKNACVRTNATLVITIFSHTFTFGVGIEPKQSAYKQ